MFRKSCWLLLPLLIATSASAQQSIYWKKDHIYNGPGGKEIAILTPAPADQTAPTAPSGLASSNVTATSVQLSWTGSTDSGGSALAGYKVYRQLGAGANLPVGTVGSATTSFTDPHLQPATSYTFTIVAFDNAQNHSVASNAITPTTLSAAADTTAPTVPANLVASLAARTTVRLDWSPSTDIAGSGVAGYRVYRGGTLISGGSLVTALSYSDSNLSYKTAYAYTVVAVDNATNASSASAAANITTDWELVFQDDFNRLDDAGLGSTNWFNSPWQVKDTRAFFSKTCCAGGFIEAYYINNGNMTDSRLTVDLVSGNANTGVSFWRVYGSPNTRYQIQISGGSMYFQYYDGSSTFDLGLVSANSTGTLRVEATSATRHIKIYLNDVLKIDYTETDTSRRNSGYAGMLANVGYGTSSVAMDNFILER